MSRIVVASRSFSRHQILRAELLQRYPDTTFNDSGRSLSGTALIQFLKGHERAITALEVINASVLDALPELSIISKYGVGLDMLDLAAMAQRGIRLGWTGGVNRRSVAELVIGFAIALLRDVLRADADLHRTIWQPRVGRQLSDCTVGIIGCGHVGKDLVHLLRPFGCRLLAHDVRDFSEFYRAHDVESVTLAELLRHADIVSLHVPLSFNTRHLLNRERLALLRPTAVVINAARGNLVDEVALAAMLRDGRLAGAAFDVFSTEPPGEIELLKLPNFLATPHIGGSTEEAILAMGRAAIRGLDENKVPAPGDECWAHSAP